MNEEIKKYLKDNLKINIKNDYTDYDFDTPKNNITIELMLENEIISSDKFTVYEGN
jgi:hypothetical protein